MSEFTFDESKGIPENLQLFFTHMKRVDSEFGTLLEELLPDFVEGHDRFEFSSAVAKVLDGVSDEEASV